MHPDRLSAYTAAFYGSRHMAEAEVDRIWPGLPDHTRERFIEQAQHCHAFDAAKGLPVKSLAPVQSKRRAA